MQMNEYDVEQTVAFLENYGEDTPNLREAAEVLHRLVRWTNRNSDGWPYWPAASRSAKKLEALLTGVRHAYARDELHDVTRAELAAACRPIKAFLTRQGVAHNEIFKED